MCWNFGDILEAIEDVLPEGGDALIHGGDVITFGESRRFSNNLARALRERGAVTGDKIALFMRNRPEYLMSIAAAWKARLTHVNINYRYQADELWYVIDNSDAAVVIYDSEFRESVVSLRSRLSKVKCWVEVGSEGGCPDFAVSFQDITRQGNGTPLRIPRSPDDMFFIYTGGTTGYPKGVMWTHRDLRAVMLKPDQVSGPIPETLAEYAAHVAATGPQGRIFPIPPLMHGTSLLVSCNALLSGGTIITCDGKAFDPLSVVEVVHRSRPETIVFVGDAFSKPVCDVLDASPGKWDLSSIQMVLSSGVMWSQEAKSALLRHIPQATLFDGLGSSEAVGLAQSVTTSESCVSTAKFSISDRCQVFDENDTPIIAGSEIAGLLAIAEPIPVGYYKDQQKSAATFRVVDGVRYAFSGDWAKVETDGTITLLGRGSLCINSAGEKVFPEEVEEALKSHPQVADALVVGLPDERWGEAVAGVVRPATGLSVDEDELRKHVRTKLAGFKVPKRIVFTDKDFRFANGKADYNSARAFAENMFSEARN